MHARMRTPRPPSAFAPRPAIATRDGRDNFHCFNACTLSLYMRTHVHVAGCQCCTLSWLATCWPRLAICARQQLQPAAEPRSGPRHHGRLLQHLNGERENDN